MVSSFDGCWGFLDCSTPNVRSDKLNAKAQKITIKLPWEILTIYSEVLPEDDEEDEDDIEAHEASVLRLKVSVDVRYLLTGKKLNFIRKQTMLRGR